MRLPVRKTELWAQSQQQADAHLTPEKISRMKRELQDLISTKRGRTIEEMQLAASDGDFSENAPYQDAKQRLRRINARILFLEEALKYAIPIEKGAANGRVQLGCTVTLQTQGEFRTYQIVGAQETDPSHGRISHTSPLAKMLLGKCVGESISFQNTDYQVIDVR